jgi:hypothetical protein
VFSQRLGACAQLIAAIEPFAAKARPDGRATVTGRPEGRYSLPQHYYGQSSGNAAFDAKHGPLVEKWRVASAAFLIVSPRQTEERLAFFDRVITREIEEGRFMQQAEMIAWLERLEAEARQLVGDCRGLV